MCGRPAQLTRRTLPAPQGSVLGTPRGLAGWIQIVAPWPVCSRARDQWEPPRWARRAFRSPASRCPPSGRPGRSPSVRSLSSLPLLVSAVRTPSQTGSMREAVPTHACTVGPGPRESADSHCQIRRDGRCDRTEVTAPSRPAVTTRMVHTHVHASHTHAHTSLTHVLLACTVHAWSTRVTLTSMPQPDGPSAHPCSSFLSLRSWRPEVSQIWAISLVWRKSGPFCDTLPGLFLPAADWGPADSPVAGRGPGSV